MSVRTTRTASVAAILGIALFPLIVVTLNLVQRNTYNPLQQPMSQLALGEDGWLMNLAFWTTGIGVLLVALVLWRSVPAARLAAALLALTGALHFVAATFLTDPTGVPPTTHGLIHNMSGLVMWLLHIVALALAGFAFRKDAEWSSFSRPTFIWAGFSLVAFALMNALAAVDLFGLGQRTFEATRLSWLIVVAWRAAHFRSAFDSPNAAPRVPTGARS